MNKIVSVAIATCVLTIASINVALAEQPGIRCVQNQLNALGFNLGTPDGTIGTKTRSAAEEYRAWMSGGAGEAGWSQPPLTALNGEFWCQKVGEAHPEVAKYAVAAPAGPQYDVTPGKMVATFDVPVAGTISAWRMRFEFKTQCENDHRIVLLSPAGRSVGLMERGLHRCSGKSAIFTSDNTDGSAFLGSSAQGTWTMTFEDLDANAYTGALTKVRMDLGLDAGGATTKYTVKLTGLPKKVPNPE
jgi:subtilisin-like proprotein convertase family protein